MLPLETLRAEFPLLASCVYLNSNSTGATPRGVRAVLDEYWRTLATWRDEAWEGWWRALHEYADALAAFVGAPAGSVVTDVNVSTLLGRLMTALDFRERPRVVTTDREFPSIPFVLAAFGRWGAEPVVAPEARLVDEIDHRTRLVCVSHASFATGALLDVGAIVRRAHEVGALVAVDAYQSLGAVPVDVRAMDVDFLLGGAHKWLCGSIESAFLYVRPELLASLRPAATGWIASADPLSFAPATEYAASARRFAAGTPAVLPCLVSQVGLRLVERVGMRAIREESLRRTARVMARADRAGLRVLTPREPERRGGVVAVDFEGSERAVASLKQRGFVASWRGAVRIAPHFYNTDDEVEAFMDALEAEARR